MSENEFKFKFKYTLFLLISTYFNYLYITLITRLIPSNLFPFFIGNTMGIFGMMCIYNLKVFNFEYNRQLNI
jgi:hypothetical protein